MCEAYQSSVVYLVLEKEGTKLYLRTRRQEFGHFKGRVGEWYLKNIVKRCEEEKLPIHVLWCCSSVTEKESTRYQTSGFKCMIIWVLVSCCSSFSQDSV